MTGCDQGEWSQPVRGLSVVAITTPVRGGTIDPLPPRTTGDDDVPMPGFLLILAATAFVVVLCLALWVIAEATGGPGVEQAESDRRQRLRLLRAVRAATESRPRATRPHSMPGRPSSSRAHDSLSDAWGRRCPTSIRDGRWGYPLAFSSPSSSSRERDEPYNSRGHDDGCHRVPERHA